jgi:hypothetical protein
MIIWKLIEKLILGHSENRIQLMIGSYELKKDRAFKLYKD